MQPFLAKFIGSHNLDITQNSPRMPKASFDFRTKLHIHKITMFRTRPHSQSHLDPGAHGNECKKTPSGSTHHQLRSQVPTLVLQGCSQPTLPLWKQHYCSGLCCCQQFLTDLNGLCAKPQAHTTLYLYVNPR